MRGVLLAAAWQLNINIFVLIRYEVAPRSDSEESGSEEEEEVRRNVSTFMF